MIFQDFWDKVLMDFTKVLFYPGLVDDICHLSCMLIRARGFRNETFFNFMLNLSSSRPRFDGGIT